MSLAIEISTVTAVLLADGWHDVIVDSFDTDSYEYIAGDLCIHGGGNSGVCSTGFTFRSPSHPNERLCGPLTAILAVRAAP